LRVVTKAFLRYLYRRRSLSVLQLMGIACGVATAIGMALSAKTALSSFRQAVEFLKGRATHSLERPAGPMDEKLLTRIMTDPAVEAFSPVIDRRIRLANGEWVRLLGVDPFLDRLIRTELSRSRLDPSFLIEDQAVLVDSQLARQLSVGAGDRLPTSRGSLRIVGVFPHLTGEPLLLMDIAQAQRFFGLPGRVDRVDLILTDEASFRSKWAEGFRLQSGEQRQATLMDMLRAFRLNLQALSLMALFVGIFLVYNTAMFTVVSRRKDAGILRSLGAKPREILFAFLTEILLLGGAGGILGGFAGFFLSRFLTTLVADSISNLYFFLKPSSTQWSWWILPGGLLLGWGASLLGSFFPLKELVRVEPIQALRGRAASQKFKAGAGKVALVGLGILGASLVLLAIPSLHVYWGFAGSFGMLLGASLLTGLVLLLLGPGLKVGLQRLSGLPGKMAAGNICQNLGRTAVAVAAFMVALSLSIGLTSMIGSFRTSLIWWMGTQLRGDLYIGRIPDMEVPENFYEELRFLPGIGGVDPFRNVQIDFRGTSVYLKAVDASVLQKYTRFGWLKGGDENWEPVKRGAVIVSESFYRRFQAGPGSQFTLNGIHGPASFEVAAVFYDYTSEHGVIMMDRSTYLKVFQDRTLNSLGIFVEAADPRRQELLQEVRKRAKNRGLPVATRDQFWGSILTLFDTTFAVTRSMRLLAIVVAFFGIAGALLTLFLERQREFGVYRALGFSPGKWPA